MILIADSGSTKTAWIFSNGIDTEQFTTSGANPFFRSTEDMVREWKNSPVENLKGKVTQINFYAAGVVNREKADIIRHALILFFPEAEISVESDLLAAAHATLGNKNGIACILGTGSNSCQFDGKQITSHVPPLGFILGDEGSGAVLGRQLIGDYLKKTMPLSLRQRFAEKHQYEYGEILNRVYRQDKPNMFLATFVPFIKDNIETEYCTGLVENAFELFVQRNIAQYTDYQNQDICFAGSVAYHFRNQLKTVFLKRKLRMGIIIKDPLINLSKYHLQQL